MTLSKETALEGKMVSLGERLIDLRIALGVQERGPAVNEDRILGSKQRSPRGMGKEAKREKVGGEKEGKEGAGCEKLQRKNKRKYKNPVGLYGPLPTLRGKHATEI